MTKVFSASAMLSEIASASSLPPQNTPTLWSASDWVWFIASRNSATGRFSDHDAVAAGEDLEYRFQKRL